MTERHPVLWLLMLSVTLAACNLMVLPSVEPDAIPEDGSVFDNLPVDAGLLDDVGFLIPDILLAEAGEHLDDVELDAAGEASPVEPDFVNAPEHQADPGNPDPLLDNGCIDTDDENNYLDAGYVVYTDENGLLVLLYDTCKIEGPGGMLKEVTCQGYHGPETTPAELEAKYIECHCEMGECVEGSVVLCTDPEAEAHHPGGSVWTNDEGKTHISVCKDPDTVTWFYCNEDGTFHTDDSACDEDKKCGDGMCGGFVCTDTEGVGEDPENLIAGAVFLYSPTTGETILLTDSCTISDKFVRAYKCPLHTGTNPNQVKKMVQQNPDLVACNEGTGCKFGICVEVEPDPDPQPVPLCQDDDPENDIYIPGLLILNTGAPTPLYFPDKCQWFYEEDLNNPGALIIETKVHQFMCNDEGGKESYMYECELDESCIAGACVKDTQIGPTCDFQCVDSDGGKDPMVGGYICGVSDVCGSTVESNDRCPTDPTKVGERYCDGNILSKETLDCPAGYFCRGINEPAKCVQCQDNDQADDPAVYGEVDDIDDVHISDFCTSDGQLKQAICNPADGLAAWSDPEDCPPGTSCLQGKCQ